MFLLSYMFIAAVIIYIGLAVFLYNFTKKRFSHKKYIPKLVLAFFILFPTYDIFITYILSGYYCSTTPSTFINKTVEYPQSIYWEDNVYPGFNEEDRKLMIRNYLDGMHLKKMALNAPDGKIYVYTREVPTEKYNEIDKELKVARKTYKNFNTKFKQPNLLEENEPLWLELRDKKIEAKKIVDEIEKQKNSLIESYSVKERIFTKQSMPKLNYTVTFNEVKLNFFSRNFLYSDVTEITDNTSNEVVAQNQRIMKLFYNITPRLSQIYYDPEPMCGYQFYRDFDGEVFIKLQYMYGGEVMNKVGLNRKLYKKNILGEK